MKVPHNRIHGGREEAEAVAETVLAGTWSSQEKVRELEGALAEATARRFVICVDSGLSAIRLALLGIGVGEGDPVLVPAYSCVALANACLAIGAEPIEVDVRKQSWNMDPFPDPQRKQSTTAIAVNTFGVPADVQGWEESGVTVIEDCAHTLGVEIEGKALGNRSRLAITSLHATKLLGAGEGGAIFTNDSALAERIAWLRDYADKPADGRLLNCFMSDLEATLALQRLAALPQILATRQSIADRYLEAFSDLERDGVVQLPTRSNATWYRFVLFVPAVLAEQAIGQLAARGVGAAKPVEDWRRKPENSPTTTLAHDHLVSLPIYPGLADEEQTMVVEAVLDLAEEWT